MSAVHIRVLLSEQQLEVRDVEGSVTRFPISTARRGPGEEEGSECTPRGRHEIAEKIGGGAPLRAVFVSREATGEVCSSDVYDANPDRDWILTRILWLSGLEPGVNAGGTRDTYRRYIYIHGTPDEARIGAPHSHGCIRMRNADVAALFDQVTVGTPVDIVA